MLGIGEPLRPALPCRSHPRSDDSMTTSRTGSTSCFRKGNRRIRQSGRTSASATAPVEASSGGVEACTPPTEAHDCWKSCAIGSSRSASATTAKKHAGRSSDSASSSTRSLTCPCCIGRRRSVRVESNRTRLGHRSRCVFGLDGHPSVPGYACCRAGKALPAGALARASCLALEEVFDRRLGPATRRVAYDSLATGARALARDAGARRRRSALAKASPARCSP